MMIAIRHKSGKWLMVNESDDYELTDELIPLLNLMGTNEEILQDIQDYSDDEFEAKDLKVIPLTILTPEQEEAKLKEAFEAGKERRWVNNPSHIIDHQVDVYETYEDWRNRK